MMTSLKKELRTLAWPAGAVLAATALPLVWLNLAGDIRGMRGTPIQLALVAFVLGTALLVALPFGTEFQQRTLMLALSQPVSRARIWLGKSGTLLAVLFVIGVLQFAGLQRFVLDSDAGMVRGATFLIALACSGFLWTLVAGSTIPSLPR